MAQVQMLRNANHLTDQLITVLPVFWLRVTSFRHGGTLTEQSRWQDCYCADKMVERTNAPLGVQKSGPSWKLLYHGTASPWQGSAIVTVAGPSFHQTIMWPATARQMTLRSIAVLHSLHKEFWSAWTQPTLLTCELSMDYLGYQVRSMVLSVPQMWMNSLHRFLSNLSLLFSETLFLSSAPTLAFAMSLH